MASRTRSKGSTTAPVTGAGSSYSIVGTFKNGISGASHAAQGGSLTSGYISYTDTRQSISDEAQLTVGSINNCTHTKTHVEVNQSTIPVATYQLKNNLTPFGTLSASIVGSPAPYYVQQQIAGFPHVAVPFGAGVALARVPSISPEMMSGLNSLYELKDCKSFLKLIPAHLLWAVARRKRAQSARLFKEWISEISDTARSPLGLLQSIAGADLMWKFGLRPMIEDVNRVHDALSQVNAKVNKLASQRFTCRGAHTEKASTSVKPVDNSILQGSYALSARQTIIHTRETTTKWVYGAQKRIDTSKLPSMDVAKMRSLTESLGLSFGATDVWEAVPYSFVFDWFIPIQTFIEQFERAKPDPSWLLNDGWWYSEKTTTKGLCTEVITPVPASGTSITASTGLTRAVPYTVSKYQRSRLTSAPPGMPNIYIPTLRTPNLAQGVTGIELLVQRIKRKLK